jgi:hypothetical protein
MAGTVKPTHAGNSIDLYYWPRAQRLEDDNHAGGMWAVTASSPSTSPRAISFLEISPNNRMPAIVDHRVPGGFSFILLRRRSSCCLFPDSTPHLDRFMRGRYGFGAPERWPSG